MRKALIIVGGVIAGALLGPVPPVRAEPALSATGVRTEPGIVEFFLSARDIPAGTVLDRTTLSVTVGDQALDVTTEPLGVGQRATEAPKRATVLVLDTSGSMTGEPIVAARAAATEYVRTLPSDVQVGVVAVATSARTIAVPTVDRPKLAAAIAGLQAGGETALYDGVRAAVDLLGKARYAQRRIVVLSDGADTTSKATLTELRAALTPAGTPVDTVAFRTPDTASDVLSDLAKRTGGRFYPAANAATLAGAFRAAAGAFALQLIVTARVPVSLAGREERLTVTTTVDGRPVATDLEVTFAADPNAAVPLSEAAGLHRLWPALEYGVLGLVFLALLLFGLVAFAPLLDVARHRRRLAQVDRYTAQRPPPPTAANESESAVARAALALSEQVVKTGGLEERLALALDRAGMRLRPHEWLLIRALVGLGTVVLFALLLDPWLGLLLGIPAAWLGTYYYQRRRAESRLRAFATLLPDALQLVIGSLRSGFALSQAIDAMVRELPDPVASEFGRALGETRLGADLEDALTRLATRMRSADLSWAVVAIRVQREVGGNLAEVLSTVVATIRERDGLRRQVRALSAEGRLSAWVLLALPLGTGAFMFVFRQDYMRPLYTEPLGIVMLIIGCLLVVVGGFWMSRAVKVEV